MATLVLSLSREASTEGRSEPGLGGLCSVASPGGAAGEQRGERAGVNDWDSRETSETGERDTVLILFIMPTHWRCTLGHQADSTSGSLLAVSPDLTHTRWRQNWPGRLDDHICQTLPFVNGFTDFLVANWSAANGPVWPIQTSVCLWCADQHTEPRSHWIGGDVSSVMLQTAQIAEKNTGIMLLQRFSTRYPFGDIWIAHINDYLRWKVVAVPHAVI